MVPEGAQKGFVTVESMYGKGKSKFYFRDDLAGGAWTVWNDIGCPVDKILIIIAKLSINEPIQKAVADLLM